jgi:hypothetical protein
VKMTKKDVDRLCDLLEQFIARADAFPVEVEPDARNRDRGRAFDKATAKDSGRSWSAGSRQREMESVHVRPNQPLDDVVAVLRDPVRRSGDGKAKYYFEQLECASSAGRCQPLGEHYVEFVRGCLGGLPDYEVDALLIPSDKGV